MWRQEVKCHVSPAASGCLGPLSPYTAGWLHPHGWNEEDVNSPHPETSPQLCIQITPENTSQSRTNKDSFLNNAHRHTDVFRDLLMPWKVLLAMSMMPPVGLVRAPTKPLPTPLKKPAAPSFWAPTATHTHTRCPLNWTHSFMNEILPDNWTSLPLMGLVTMPVMPLTNPCDDEEKTLHIYRLTSHKNKLNTEYAL